MSKQLTDVFREINANKSKFETLNRTDKSDSTQSNAQLLDSIQQLKSGQQHLNNKIDSCMKRLDSKEPLLGDQTENLPAQNYYQQHAKFQSQNQSWSVLDNTPKHAPMPPTPHFEGSHYFENLGKLVENSTPVGTPQVGKKKGQKRKIVQKGTKGVIKTVKNMGTHKPYAFIKSFYKNFKSVQLRYFF